LQIIVAKLLIDQGFIIDDFHGILGLHEIPRLVSQIFTVFVFLLESKFTRINFIFKLIQVQFYFRIVYVKYEVMQLPYLPILLIN